MPPSPDAPGPHKNLIGHRIADGRLELVSVLGLGAYGVVYLARDLTHPHHQNKPFASSSASSLPRSLAASNGGSAATGYYAVKCLSKVGLDSRQRSFQRREIMLHTIASNHPSVVTLHRVIDCPQDPCVYVILDYCPDGDLFSMITEHQRYLVAQPETLAQLEDAAVETARAARIDANLYLAKHQETLRVQAEQSMAQYRAERSEMDALIKRVFCQIIDAVEFCHSYGIYHRDLKPENILCLHGGAKVVLADFGLATGEKASSDFGCGSTFYMGPECQGGITSRLSEYSTAANDIWSLGVILVNLMCGRNPWKQACTADETFREYLRRPDFLMDILPISEEANGILKRIFTVRPEWRISTRDLRKAVIAVESFTVTEAEMKAREHRARIAAAQARAAQKAASAAAAQAAKEQQRALAERYMAQQQQRDQQLQQQQQIYSRQQQAMLLQQQQQQQQNSRASSKAHIQVQNQVFADAYDDANEDVETIHTDADVSDDEEGEEWDEEDEDDDDLHQQWNNDRSSWSTSSDNKRISYGSSSSSSRGGSSGSSVPTSPESTTANNPTLGKVLTPVTPSKASKRNCSTSRSSSPVYEDCASSSPGARSDSNSSRCSSFSYTGLPPTPRFAATGTFVDDDSGAIRRGSKTAIVAEGEMGVHAKLSALVINPATAAKASGTAPRKSLRSDQSTPKILGPEAFADRHRQVVLN